KAALPVSEGQILTVKVLEAHANNPADGIARIEGYVLDIEDGGHRLGQTVRVVVEKAYRTYARARLVDS
ncbi:MAG: TRAM domain-containing protein, partial [Firmicutes bacterium]|nr:TRAM domain-containing protein [Bacillota bacterium]